jgi:predicted NUDIX family NTP pyrophosphohydrolase
MPAKKSAGIIPYRLVGDQLEVLLAHPGGPFWKNKDLGAWSIVKGEYNGNEEPLDAAKREWKEETGLDVSGRFISLKPVKQKSGKEIIAWAVEADIDPSHITSNEFEIEWPPKSGRRQSFPEIDKVQWMPVATAKDKINPGQAPLLDQLLAMLAP